MADSFNPYAAPTSVQMDPVAVEWLSAPSISLKRVALGLGMIYSGIVMILLGALAIFLMGFVLGNLAPWRFLVFGFTAVIGIGLVLQVVGPLFCLATPAETGAAAFVYASVAAMILGLAISVAEVLQVSRVIEPLPLGVEIAHQVLSAISIFTFLLFLNRLNKFIGKRDLARRAQIIFGMFAVLLVLALSLALTPRTFRFVDNGIYIVILVLAILAVTAFVMYVSLLGNTRRAILRGAPPGEPV